MKKILSIILVAITLFSLFTCTVSAAGSAFAPYKSYEYNEFDEAIIAPVGYTYKQSLTAEALGLDKALKGPSDIVVYDDHIYILDSGNGRILELDMDYKLIKEYKDFVIDPKYADNEKIIAPGGKISFGNAKGFDITPDGEFVIADTSGNRILRIDREGVVNLVVLRPDEVLNDTGAVFSPEKVSVDDRGRIYVMSQSITLGIMVFAPDGDFIEFFAANEVLSTTQAFIKFLRELLMTNEQLDLLKNATPVTVTNMDFSPNGFAYTVNPYRDTTVTTAVPGLVRKLNYKGESITQEDLVFGDLIATEAGEKKTTFADIDIDDNGFLNILDKSRGRIFQYTDSGQLLSVFGANSDQEGCFTVASAIETVGDRILVTDSSKNAVLIFEATAYIKNVHEAVVRMDNNDFEGSAEIWNELLKQNSNSYLCYQGLGRIADYNGEYVKAMEYYKLAYDQDGYALAFKENRQINIEKNALWIVIGVVAVGVLIFIGIKYLKKLATPTADSAYSKMESKYGMPFYVLLHPIDGCAQFKRRPVASFGASAIIVFAWLVFKIIDFNMKGFAFSINRSVDFNMPITILVTVGMYALFCISNWAICSLMDGKGTFKDICATTAYGLIPYIVTLAMSTILTNFLVPQEQVFIGIVTTIGLIWSAGVLILGLLTIHDFSLGKTIWTILLTLLGMAAIILLAILLFSLMKQMFGFFESVYKEIDFRY